VKGELERHFTKTTVGQLTNHNGGFFENPAVDEMDFVREIYRIRHFRQNLDRKKLLQGGYFADPFVIAKARVKIAVVVTEEELRNNGARIPNICTHFGVQCTNLEGFLTEKDWKF
jgi:Domain of unknown function (DUF4411)